MIIFYINNEKIELNNLMWNNVKMLKLLLTAFLALPLQKFQVNNNDILEYIYKLPTLVLLIPTVTRHNDNCKTDDDCALTMRCCEVGKKRYCCTPNNFVKMSLAYQNEEIKQTINNE